MQLDPNAYYNSCRTTGQRLIIPQNRIQALVAALDKAGFHTRTRYSFRLGSIASLNPVDWSKFFLLHPSKYP